MVGASTVDVQEPEVCDDAGFTSLLVHVAVDGVDVSCMPIASSALSHVS